MIRFFILFALFAQFTFSGLAQESNYFEGTVFYTYDVVVKRTGVDAKKVKKILGDGSTLNFKEGNYRHNFSGGTYEFDLYNQQENKLYFKLRNNDTIYWYNCGATGDKINKLDYTTKKEVILGIECDKMIIHYNDRRITHYFNADSLSINPAWFKNYLRNDQNQIDQMEKAIYLKSEIELPYFFLSETAKKIERKEISAKIFEISADAILVEKKIIPTKTQ